MTGEGRGPYDNAHPRLQHRPSSPDSQGTGPGNLHFNRPYRGFCLAGRFENRCSGHSEKTYRSELLMPCWLPVKQCGCPQTSVPSLGKPTAIRLCFRQTPPHCASPLTHTYVISRGSAFVPTWGHRRRSCQGGMTMVEGMQRHLWVARPLKFSVPAPLI